MWPQRLEMLNRWREEIHKAAKIHKEERVVPIDGRAVSEIQTTFHVQSISAEPWFSELRAHLPVDSEFCYDLKVQCDPDTVMDLINEVSRIEREWRAEAQG